jgi:hypothetical protein
VGAGVGREAARTLWPLVLQLWEAHPLVVMVVGGAIAVGAALFLAWLWEIIRPPPWQPHEVYRPPVPDDAHRPEKTGPRHDTRQ